MDKSSLRKQMLEKRNSIPASVRKVKSAAIEQRLEELEIYRQAYTILFYVSFGSEADTHSLIKQSFKAKKKVAVPFVSGKHLDVKQITGFSQLKPGAMGILEPDKKQPSINLADINLVIVPGVAFDKKHYRLGYGGGYYDRLLAKGGDFTAIGLAYEEQIVDDLPIKEHDQKVDFIITDKRII